MVPLVFRSKYAGPQFCTLNGTHATLERQAATDMPGGHAHQMTTHIRFLTPGPQSLPLDPSKGGYLLTMVMAMFR